MKTVLVTGATSFLGYHVARRLNDAGIRPRVLEPRESRRDALDRLDVERCSGHLGDPAATRAACDGVDMLLHLAFKVNAGGGKQLLDEMRTARPLQPTLDDAIRWLQAPERAIESLRRRSRRAS